jgi:hypothetical protein
MILVVGDVATSFYHLLESLGHRLHEILEIGGVLHPDDPQLQDFLLQLLQVGGGAALKLCINSGPHIFKRVDVRPVARPFIELNVGLPSKPVLDHF